jgi:hypothetical protein
LSTLNETVTTTICLHDLESPADGRGVAVKSGILITIETTRFLRSRSTDPHFVVGIAFLVANAGVQLAAGPTAAATGMSGRFAFPIKRMGGKFLATDETQDGSKMVPPPVQGIDRRRT